MPKESMACLEEKKRRGKKDKKNMGGKCSKQKIWGRKLIARYDERDNRRK